MGAVRDLVTSLGQAGYPTRRRYKAVGRSARMLASRAFCGRRGHRLDAARGSGDPTLLKRASESILHKPVLGVLRFPHLEHHPTSRSRSASMKLQALWPIAHTGCLIYPQPLVDRVVLLTTHPRKLQDQSLRHADSSLRPMDETSAPSHAHEPPSTAWLRRDRLSRIWAEPPKVSMRPRKALAVGRSNASRAAVWV